MAGNNNWVIIASFFTYGNNRRFNIKPPLQLPTILQNLRIKDEIADIMIRISSKANYASNRKKITLVTYLFFTAALILVWFLPTNILSLKQDDKLLISYIIGGFIFLFTFICFCNCASRKNNYNFLIKDLIHDFNIKHSPHGMSLKWIKNYNQNFTHTDGDESHKYPKVETTPWAC